MGTGERRKRGEGKNTVPLHLTVDPLSYRKVERVAEALGISKARALDVLLAHIDVDVHGRPEGYEGRLATDNQKELPLPRPA